VRGIPSAILRLALACEFIGHGAFGLMTKPDWVRYFGVFGISESAAYELMPVVGSIDVVLGVLALVAPMRGPLLYMAFWGFFTALLRPLSGESGWEFVERTYNFGVPALAFVLLGAGTPRPGWFTVLRDAPPPAPATLDRTRLALRTIMVAMLAGHGFITLERAPGLAGGQASVVIAAIDFVLAAGCARLSAIPFFAAVFAWKLGSEFLHVPAGAYGAWWEVMERGSSYAAPLLWIALARSRAPQPVAA